MVGSAPGPLERPDRAVCRYRPDPGGYGAASVGVVSAGLPSPEAVAGGNLPSQLTSFLGREEEIGKVEQLMSRHRLVTVTGPGGAGKTRLALAVARRLLGHFEDGGRFVELAQIDDPDLVVSTAAEAFGVRQSPGLSMADSLGAVIGGRHALLVLDNCEHVLDAAGDLCTQLLRAGLDLHVLATSREPLQVEGEVRLPLAPLATPDPRDSTDEAASCASVALFVERARDRSPDFEFSPASIQAVTRIVRRLDGMPLAIELAAAQTDVIGLEEVVASLDDRFRVLINPTRNVSSRQASLQATVDWSYRLLDEHERAALRRLSVFPGPFTLEAGTATARLGSATVVQKLVRRSLLNAPRAGEDGRSRYSMLETVRAFAAERISDTEREEAQAAMATWMVGETERVAASFACPDDGPAGRWGDAEQDNLRAAMEWLLGRAPRDALRLAIAIGPWAFLRGHYAEGRLALENALAAAPGSEPELVAKAELWLGRLAHYRSDLGVGLEHFRRVEELLRPAAPSAELVDALVGETWELLNLDDNSLAVDKGREALDLARAVGHASGESHAASALSLAALYAGDYPAALGWAQLARAVDRERSSGHAIRFALTTGALSYASTGELGEAERLLVENLGLCRDAGDRNSEAMQLESLARIEIKLGRRHAAAEHIEEATRISAEVGERLRLADCLATAAVWASAERPEDAALLWGAGRACADTISPYRVPIADIVDRSDLTSAEDSDFFTPPMIDVLDRIGMEEAKQAEDRGAAMSLDAVLAFVRDAFVEQRPASVSPAGVVLNLTKRERDLVALVAEGLTDAEIAEKLFISIRTVRSHLDRIKDKTGARRRAELTRLAVSHGLA